MSTFGAFVSVVALAVGLLVACSVKPPSPIVDVTTMARCPAEDGPGDGPNAVVPCVFDTTGGNGTGVYGVPWILYWGSDQCPERVAPAGQVHCVRRSDWVGR